jgi:cobalt-precorrin 5A hydrolase
MMVAGFGFRGGATLASLHDALARALHAAGPSPAITVITLITQLATAHDKADAACLLALAAQLGLPVCAVAPGQISNAATWTDSRAVRARRNTGSVAEAAALAAAGPGGRLLQPLSVSSDRLATCALAAPARIQRNAST